MFIDYAEIKVFSGKGGDGMSSFRREKYVPKGGPDGGDGGRGGNIYFIGDKNLSTLVDFHYQREFKAKPGEKGGTSNMTGRNAEDMYIKVPCGTIVRDRASKKIIKDIVAHGETLLAAKGGRGGKGNARFTSSTRQAPRFYERGEPGEERELVLELKILADVGIIGMANAGKSTLLSKITHAKPKIADYPFTTLTPVLGIVKISDEVSFLAADIPGLIEGASSGKGLGAEFLRHIERTRVYIHVVDPTQGDALKNYRMINRELKSYDKALLKRPQVVLINKADLLSKEEIKKIRASFKRAKIGADFICAREAEGLEKAMKKVYNILKETPADLTAAAPEYVEGEGDELLHVEKLEESAYRLRGKKLEKYVAMLDFNHQETIEKFRQYLDKNGVNVLLKEKGVREGDLVIIGDKEFKYED